MEGFTGDAARQEQDGDLSDLWSQGHDGNAFASDDEVRRVHDLSQGGFTVDGDLVVPTTEMLDTVYLFEAYYRRRRIDDVFGTCPLGDDNIKGQGLFRWLARHGGRPPAQGRPETLTSLA